MKTNGNDKTTGNYFLGLDVGTNSVGWAVTNKDYTLKKCKGNAMWGARLFDEAKDASARRTSRTNRRRLARRNQRLLLLELLFSEEIAKVDPSFFLRMEESALWLDDKTNKTCRFSLFNDPGFTDKDYHKRYPTAYHLRNELMKSSEPHDIRLVYLALHHIMKSRGHFLYDTAAQDDTIRPIEDAFQELNELLLNEYDTSIVLSDAAAFFDMLSRGDMGVKAKQKALKASWGGTENTETPLNISVAMDLLAGKSGIKASALFTDLDLTDAEPEKLSLSKDIEDHFDAISAVLGDRMDVFMKLKDVYDTAQLSQMLHGHATLSEAKIALYNKNHDDLRALKSYVRQNAPDKYKEIFTLKQENLNNYPAYSGYKSRGGDHFCTQEEFCKYLNSLHLPVPESDDANMARIFSEIKECVFLSKLRGTVNGVIPYQLQRMELRAIVKNASTYLSFLNEADGDGNTVCDKVEKTFEFRLPYYVGPLNKKAGSYWAVRFPGKEGEKIYPWNFERIIDTEASAKAFMMNLVGRCTYTGERVLPKDSLLYSEYMLLNELNPLSINGKPIPVYVKQAIVKDLFENSRRPISKKAIWKYLRSRNYIGGDVTEKDIGGVDDRIKTTLRSYHDFREILERTGDREMVENIILHILVFGSDRQMLKKWLRSHTHGLTEEDYDRISRLKYSDWGRLSACFLSEILSADPEEGTGEAHNIMDMLRNSNLNLMQLLKDKYAFAKQAEAHRRELVGGEQSLTDRLNEMYIAPAVRRSIRQTLRIVDEIVDIEKAVPEKIFIEMARDSAKEMKGKRTESRKDKLLALYAKCSEQAAELLPMLEKEDDNRLRSDKLFLYYTQFGKCMYSGEPIDLDALMSGQRFDIDHIFPRSRIKDNSLDNRVVVNNILNRDKTNIYPIGADIRMKMRPYWGLLKEHGMISEKKYDRLIRSEPLTDEELSSFVARQLTETQQSTKALTVLLKETYGDATRIIFSKAGNVSDFRHDFDMIKCREVNDLHHAKDAYLNIVVGNVYCTRFTDHFFNNIRNEKYSLNKVFAYDVPGAWEKEETIKTVKKVMAKNNPIVTRMPREVKGKIFDLQPVLKAKAKIPKKEALPKERYGGYTSRYAAFFSVVEHSKGKKRIRTIEPVYLYAKNLYACRPEEYCRTELGLDNPKIIVPIIRIDSVFELNGIRLFLTGGTDSQGDGRDVYDLFYQLVMDYDKELLMKSILKFLERAEAKREERIPTLWDGIDCDELIELYGWFSKKLEANVYRDVFAKEKAVLEENYQRFKMLSPIAQCRILKQILIMLQCNAVKPDFTELCGKKVGQRIRKSCNLSAVKSAHLIHQSVTGLFEVRENLLE